MTDCNIDDIVQSIDPWSFTVTIGGKDYQTRQPTIGELAQLNNLRSLTWPIADKLLTGLFVGGPPSLTHAQCIAFAGGYAAHFAKVAAKKSQAAAAGAGAASDERAKAAMEAEGGREGQGVKS